MGTFAKREAFVMDPKFACHECGKTYKWKPELAGRKVKCKCGAVMAAPKAPPAAEDEPDLDALYDLADAGQQAAAAAPAMIRCPSCTGEMEPGTQVCPSCGFNLKTGRKGKSAAAAAGGGGRGPSVAAIPAGAGARGGGAAATAAPGGGLAAFQAYGAPRKGLQKDAEDTGVVTEWVLPILFIVVGIGLSVAQATQFNTYTLALPDAMKQLGMRLVLSLVLMVVAGALCIKWGEIAFGAPGPAALKIAALAIGPAALAQIVSFLLNDRWGMVGFFLAFGMYFVMCHYLFEWDMSEKWIVTGVTLVICMLAVPVIITMAFGPAKSAVRNDDAFVAARIDMGRTTEVQGWMKESSGRILGDCPRDACEAIVAELYSLGAQEILIQPEGPQAAEMLIKMPKDEKRRKAIVEAYNKFSAHHKVANAEDKGGKWMLLRYLPIADPPTLDQ
jgi:hypothetical protein